MERWISFPSRHFKLPLAPGSAERIKVRVPPLKDAAGPDVTSVVCRLRNRAVAIDAIHFNCGARLSVEFSGAVAVLLQVAVDALHTFLQMNIREVRGFLKLFRIVRRNRGSFFIKQAAFPVSREHRAKEPAMAVKIGELGVLQFCIEFSAACLGEKLYVGPQPAGGRAFWIPLRHLEFFLLGGIALLFRIHRAAVGFVVPPGIAEIGGHHVCAWMHMADHALARRDRTREFVADGMAGFFARNRRVFRRAETAISERSILSGMFGGAIVGIDDVARRATAGAIFTRLIVGPRQGKQRIEEAGLLQSEENRVGA